MSAVTNDYFQTAYKNLNEAQKQAVDTIEGPVLVIAGPGTGKTQLLSARVANILTKTDTLPQNILCLTFTEAAALNMRERLSSMIGELAYDVQINTYHSFASDIIRSYPDYFEHIDLETGQDSRMERPIDEIRQYQIMKDIIAALSFDDPLYSAKHYVKSVIGSIGDFKQANLTPEQVRALAAANLAAYTSVSPSVQQALATMKTMPRKAEAAVALFHPILEALQQSDTQLAQLAAEDLATAIDAAEQAQKTNPITTWKNTWLHKNDVDQWQFTDPAQSRKLASLASMYKAYQTILEQTGQYDFNDMILRTIQALQDTPELRYNIQETYQYVLLDEFQDTNQAQFDLVKLLVDHPVHEGRPNIMAVGDDDQGIFAFQGANIGNMVSFIESFRDVTVINLTQNYRSHRDILHVAHNIAEQIESRLHHGLQGITKTIDAASTSLPAKATIARHEFRSQANEYGWIADKIADLVTAGVNPSEISVIAPKHAILEELVPFLNQRNIPVSYEKRENIFETPLVQGILLFCQVLRAASEQQYDVLDTLLPRLFSLDYWQIPAETIWTINWQHYKEKFNEYQPWHIYALQSPELADPTRFIMALALQTAVLPLEETLDYITGAKPFSFDSDSNSFTSPLKEYYFNEQAQTSSAQAFYEAISHLSVIRSHLREQQLQTESQLHITHLLQLYETYVEAEQSLMNTHPIAQATAAVQLQTVYKAKGLEYDYVFLPSMHDDIWGSSVKGNNSKISLPANLKHISHDASTEDTKRRLLFVAITRAKHGLFTTSYAAKENGKPTLPAKYFLERESGEGRMSDILPEHANQIELLERSDEQIWQDVDTLWHSRHHNLSPDMRSLLSERLAHYVMSPTHLNTFTNLEYAGPQQFLLGTLLRFPESQTADSIYGDALHTSLEWWQKEGSQGTWHTIDETIHRFSSKLQRSYLSDAQKQELNARGSRALRAYLGAHQERLKGPAKAEVDFRKEGVVLGDAILTGKIDRLEIDEEHKTVRIIDFKSGTPATKWSSESKYLNYRQQLYFYMLLIEKSHTYQDYKVESAALEFLEPLSDGRAAQPLILPFKQSEYDELKQLVTAVWQHVQELSLPNVRHYGQTPAGSRAFIKDLRNGDI